MKVVSFLNHAMWHNLLGCVIKALCTPAEEHNGYKEPKLWTQRKGQPVWAPPSLSPIVSAWSSTRLRLRGSYRVNRVSEPSCWGHTPYTYIYTYMFPINRCLSFTAREGSRMGPLEFSGFVWLLCVFACADPCGRLCIHMWYICVFACMCPLVMHALTCCWSDLGAWTCSSFASVRLLHTPSSFQKKSIMIKDAYSLICSLSLVCSVFRFFCPDMIKICSAVTYFSCAISTSVSKSNFSAFFKEGSNCI